MHPPKDLEFLNESFDRAWSGMGTYKGEDRLCGELIAAYSEPHRKYHSVQHLVECLQGFESVRDMAVRPFEVELALWFHDAIYNVKRSDNEQQSADWARRELESASVPSDVVERIFQLVLVTRHTGVPTEADQQLLVDIDLSILGASGERFSEYEKQIRDEYAFVPGFLFRRKRREILKSFAARPRIYGTDHFHTLIENRARANLQQAIV